MWAIFSLRSAQKPLCFLFNILSQVLRAVTSRSDGTAGRKKEDRDRNRWNRVEVKMTNFWVHSVPGARVGENQSENKLTSGEKYSTWLTPSCCLSDSFLSLSLSCYFYEYSVKYVQKKNTWWGRRGGVVVSAGAPCTEAQSSTQPIRVRIRPEVLCHMSLPLSRSLPPSTLSLS